MSETQSSGPVSPVIGYVERMSDGELVGWAFDRDQPRSRPEIRVCLDGVVAVIGTADEFRADLAEAGYGDGGFGFRVKLPRTAAWRDSGRITVMSGPASAETELPWPNRGIILPEPPEEGLPVPLAFPPMEPAFQEALFTLLLHADQLGDALARPELANFTEMGSGNGMLESLLRRLARVPD